MSRNRDRMGQNRPDATGAAAPQQMTQDGAETNSFSFVIPTEFVELPSKGRFYAEGHPLHNEDTIEIKQMTAKEEDLLSSRSLLKKGVALDRVIASLIIDKRISADSLLVGDRNAVMVAARISAYGSEYNTKINCPSCNAVQEYSFNLFESGINNGTASEELAVKDMGNGFFSTYVPKTKCEVVFRLLNGRDEKLLLDQIENARKKNRDENPVTRQLRSIIVAVNNDDSPQTLDYFVNNVPSLDAQHIRAAYSMATPNIDLTQFFSCEECGFETDMEVPLTSDFFWPKR